MKPLTLIYLVFLFHCLPALTSAQVDPVNLVRPVISEAQQTSLNQSMPERIRFEAVLIDSLLTWTNSLECSYRIAGFLSSTNERLLLNRAHLLTNNFQGDSAKMLRHLNDRLLEILSDSDQEHLFSIKEKQWNSWLRTFIQWIPTPDPEPIEETSLSPLSFNLMKHFSYYGSPKSF
ncbi:MAG: hypothetical protein KDC34_06830 [Saprospiraceae bacterium]|nr:hypothetical protein [Saprospiraceae bacterium]